MKRKTKRTQEDTLTAEEQATMFGTYNIQRTADTLNDYPAIAQGKINTNRH